ncbi:MAG: methyltransferase domain-containing protein [Actinomycetota bacterium]
MARPLRIGILVVAYNASSTLRSVLARIDPEMRARITGVLVSDDHSADDTYAVGLEVQREEAGLPLTVVRQPRNLGYGGNQKFGYRWAVEEELDIVVLLHGDGQYAPERLPDLIAPIERGEADVVMGSRMMVPGAARAGGMPGYKYVGNRILTGFQNAVSGLHLSEWHSGYRAFSVAALARIPFEQNSNGFDFDTEVLLQLHDSGARVLEVPIPTYYGDEICYVDGIAYARAVVADVVRYRLQRVGFGDDSLAVTNETYELKPDEDSSHSRLVSWVGGRRALRILDLGCADGFVASGLRQLGHRVTGVDMVARPGVKDRLDEFVEADLDHGLPLALADGKPFDLVVAADVLEHVRDPESLLRELHDVLAPDGRVLVSVPNFGHWYPRLRVALGRFDYDRRGILDRGHVRFFTRRSFDRVLHRSGWHVLRREATGLPFDVADRGGPGGLSGRLRRTVGRLDAAGVRLRPTLFGYQLLYELEPAIGRV